VWLDLQRDAPNSDNLNALDKRDINRFDRPYAGRWNPTAAQYSDAVLFASAIAPLGLLADEGKRWRNLYEYSQVQLLTLGGVLFSKASTTRYRPYAYSDEAPLEERTDIDTKRSFFSGHAAHISASAFYLAHKLTGSQLTGGNRPWIWAGATAVAITGGTLRVQAGKHFPTDVIAGAAWGALTATFVVKQKHNDDSKVILQSNASQMMIGFTQAF
jgi:membrane-associated phospholipid phosphatase